MRIIQSAGGVAFAKFGNQIRILLLKKNDGSWVIPKGRVKRGESKSESAIREISEEAGIDKKMLRTANFLGNAAYIAHQPEDSYATRPKIVSFFLIESLQRKVKPLKEEGFCQAKWIPIRRAIGIASFNTHKAIIWKAWKMLAVKKTSIKQMVIAVGGRGIRIQPYFKKINFQKNKLLFPINGEPLLKKLIDDGLAIKMNKILLLTNHNEDQIIEFVHKYYPRNEHIRIHSGRNGGKGVAGELAEIKSVLAKPFIFSDGNIIYDREFLKQLSSKETLSNNLIVLGISQEDKAPTHSEVIRNGKKILFVGNRYTDQTQEKRSFRSDKKYCSMGLMAIDNSIFDLVTNLGELQDLDIIVERIFRNKFDVDFEIISSEEYLGNWFAIHNEDDISLTKSLYA